MGYHDLRFDQGEGLNRSGMQQKVLDGEVYVFRQALQAFGLYDMWHEATIRGITASVGKEAADRAERDGFHRIHEWVSPIDIPKVTDAVYAEIEPLTHDFLDRFMKGTFPDVETFFYERAPNVRFHIPYDIARSHKDEFNKFAKTYGQGKIAAHGPHRDSWLDCPSNGMNLWFAMGRIRPGNGLTIYPDDYVGEYKFETSGNISDGEKLHKTWTFDLHPGDVVIFHTDHVHGSELNRTNETRFAISCRLSVDRPVFPQLHHHNYVYSGWSGSGALNPLAEWPAKLQSSYVTSLALRARNKLIPSMAPENPEPNPAEAIGTKTDRGIEVPLSEVPPGTVRGASAALCVAHLSEGNVVALTRRCPHAGGDLANGWVDGDTVVCPWHNLPFKAKTGKSACETLPKLKRVACHIDGDTIIIDPKSEIKTNEDSEIEQFTEAAATS
ncbi:Rieske 2Fe-2S domain-containing protein [Ruegeria sp. HKCCD7255]|uniref:Rieske 2Fe-2S domain-containing protein n=1 Tax=Ruegeria sp. HKCCD7255 TaxID=2683004 RepID=UPI0014894F34|nr:Rieske 2Fe-2S domain-containing protein [Ruegeria sp. HKCCD7255]